MMMMMIIMIMMMTGQFAPHLYTRHEVIREREGGKRYRAV